MSKSLIKSFSVYGLFGTSNVHIVFDDEIKIIVGENGSGKTQLLNIFYFTLRSNFFRLSGYNFDKLVLAFNDEDELAITKKEIDSFFKNIILNNSMAKEVIDEIGYSKFEKLLNSYIKSKGNLEKLETEIYKSAVFRKYSTHKLIRIFEKFNESLFIDNNKSINNHRERIENILKDDISILYFPTYRRVEEDILNIEDDFTDNKENSLIQFGMNDVKRNFKQIEQKINSHLKEGFSKISGEILSKLIKGFPETDIGFLNKVDEKDIEIILSRVGNNLPDNDKNEIREMFLNKKVENPSLLYFLQKLIEIYELQKELDNSIKTFRDVCNKYLVNKKVFYDESNIKIFIKSDLNNSEIELNYLSSGEKQIISMFTKIYLSESNRKFIILFDEPELSLSIIWQKQLLPDIVNSKKCVFMLAVTHSPFIFDNEFDKYAIGLNEYTTYIKQENK